MLLMLSLLSLLQAAPADPTPTMWRIRGDVAGNPLNQLCTVRVEGAKLSGSCEMQGKSYPLTGEVRDDRVTFQHGGEYEGQSLTIVYSGTAVSAEEVRGTVTVQPYSVSGNFVATQEPANP